MTLGASERWTERAGPALWCLLAAALFGAATPASKPLVSELGAALLAGLLYAGAAVSVLPWALRSHTARRVDGRNRWRLLGAVVFGGLLGPLLLLVGLRAAPAGAVSLWLTLETVATALFARWLFQEHLGRLGGLAVALVVVASTLLSSQLEVSRAALLVALACACWGLDNNLTSQIDGYTPERITMIKGAATAAVMIPAGLLAGASPTWTSALAATLIGAGGYGASLVLYVAGAQQLGATRSQLLFSTAPLFGLFPAWYWLGEELRWSHGVAVVLMGVALWLLHRDSSTHSHRHRHAAVTHTHFHRHDDGHHGHQHTNGEARGSFVGWHQHAHSHEEVVHDHPHRPDLHHRHRH